MSETVSKRIKGKGIGGESKSQNRKLRKDVAQTVLQGGGPTCHATEFVVGKGGRCREKRHIHALLDQRLCRDHPSRRIKKRRC